MSSDFPIPDSPSAPALVPVLEPVAPLVEKQLLLNATRSLAEVLNGVKEKKIEALEHKGIHVNTGNTFKLFKQFPSVGDIEIPKFNKFDPSDDNNKILKYGTDIRNLGISSREVTRFDPHSKEFSDSINWNNPIFLKADKAITSEGGNSYILLTNTIFPENLEGAEVSAYLRTSQDYLGCQYMEREAAITIMRNASITKSFTSKSLKTNLLGLIGRDKCYPEIELSFYVPPIESATLRDILISLMTRLKVGLNASTRNKYRVVTATGTTVAIPTFSPQGAAILLNVHEIYGDFNEVCLSYLSVNKGDEFNCIVHLYISLEELGKRRGIDVRLDEFGNRQETNIRLDKDKKAIVGTATTPSPSLLGGLPRIAYELVCFAWGIDPVTNMMTINTPSGPVQINAANTNILNIVNIHELMTKGRGAKFIGGSCSNNLVRHLEYFGLGNSSDATSTICIVKKSSHKLVQILQELLISTTDRFALSGLQDYKRTFQTKFIGSDNYFAHFEIERALLNKRLDSIFASAANKPSGKLEYEEIIQRLTQPEFRHNLPV